jgi:periplasmic protein TonB
MIQKISFLLLVISLTTAFSRPCLAQADPEQQGEEIFTIVEQSPEFPGGEEARIKFLVEHIKYPEQAKEEGIEGTVYASFVVEKDGSISNVIILRGVGSLLDKEVIRIIHLMPKWKPGQQRGKAVRVQYNMPVKFSLDKKEKPVKQ